MWISGSFKQSLEATVESCVNRVGVDLNTASWALLRYVAGIKERTAEKIVEYRNEQGASARARRCWRCRASGRRRSSRRRDFCAFAAARIRWI